MKIARQSDETSDEDVPPFEAFVAHIFVALSHLKISKNSHSSTLTTVIDTCVTTLLLTVNFLLVVSEAIDVHNGYDLPSFAARINPLLFHLLGFIKWTYCITQYKEIEALIDNMKLCHEMCQNIDRSEEGNVEE